MEDKMLKIATKNINNIASPVMSDADGIVSVTNSGRYIPRRNDNTAENLITARAALKKKYIESETPIMTKDTMTDWHTSSNFYWSNANNMVCMKTVYASQYYNTEYSQPRDFSSFSHFRINVKIDNMSDHSQFYVRFHTSDSAYASFYLLQDSTAIFGKGEITFDKASCIIHEGFSWSSVSMIRFYVGRSNNVDSATLYVSDFYGVVKKPKNAKILFRLDDGLLSVYQGAMPVFRKYNIPASCYVNPGYVLPNDHAEHSSYGGNLAMSLVELKELQAMGWSMCSHTWYHNLYRDPTVPASANSPRYKYSQAYADLSATQDWLYDNGFNEGALCHVYGNHYYNEETFQAEKDLMLIGFTRHSCQTVFDTLPWGEGVRHIASYDFFQHSTVEGVEVFPRVDDAISHGGLTVVMCHRFDDIDDILPNRQGSVSNQGSIKPETLDLCLSYICSKENVDCITAEDLVYATPVALR